MIRLIDGKPVQVPDDARITPELQAARDGINRMLSWLQGPEAKAIERQYREGVLSRMPGFDWYTDGEKPMN